MRDGECGETGVEEVGEIKVSIKQVKVGEGDEVVGSGLDKVRENQ